MMIKLKRRALPEEILTKNFGRTEVGGIDDGGVELGGFGDGCELLLVLVLLFLKEHGFERSGERKLELLSPSLHLSLSLSPLLFWKMEVRNEKRKTKNEKQGFLFLLKRKVKMNSNLRGVSE